MQMKISKTGGRSQIGFTFVEVLVAIAVSAFLFLSLYGGFSSGWMVTELSRENLRATQVMVEKMETIRLYNWTQINSNGFVPATFTDTYYPSATNQSQRGLVYNGRVVISSATNLGVAYSSNIR